MRIQVVSNTQILATLVDGSFIAVLQQGAEKWGNEAGLCPGPEGGGSLGKPRWHTISRCAYKDSSHRTLWKFSPIDSCSHRQWLGTVGQKTGGKNL